jgi:hypothetical protein
MSLLYLISFSSPFFLFIKNVKDSLSIRTFPRNTIENR